MEPETVMDSTEEARLAADYVDAELHGDAFDFSIGSVSVCADNVELHTPLLDAEDFVTQSFAAFGMY